MKGHPYLHDFFKSFINYDAESVLEILKKNYPELDLWEDNPEISYVREEPLVSGNKYADVAWIIEGQEIIKEQETTSKVIIHEIKTGNYSIQEIWDKYHNKEVFLNGEKLPIDYIFVWAWEEKHRTNLLEEKGTILDHLELGHFILLPLELLLPFTIPKLKEMRLIFEENLEKWDPSTDYSRKLKDAFEKRKELELWNNITPNILNIIMEYMYSEWDDALQERIYLKKQSIIKGEVGYAEIEDEEIEAMVPLTCDNCGETFFLPVLMEVVGYESGGEKIWAIVHQDTCPYCENTIDLDIEAYQEPTGWFSVVNINWIKGGHFPTEQEIKSKINKTKSLLKKQKEKKIDRDQKNGRILRILPKKIDNVQKELEEIRILVLKLIADSLPEE